MRSSFRSFAPAVRQAAQASSKAGSKTRLFVGVAASATLAYALVPHKQTLFLDSGKFLSNKLYGYDGLKLIWVADNPFLLLLERKTRSAWIDPPPVEPKVQARDKEPTPLSPTSEDDQAEGSSKPPKSTEGASHEGEAEDPKSAAFDPVTGEINWDCPCLGGMAHGPCGQEFRDAFSCFVYSEEEPKGINCVEKFKGMQDCFRAHPDVYGEGMLL